MIITEYQKDFFDILKMLHESQNSELSQILTPLDIPAIGFLVSDSATPIAMGFLRMVEGNYAMIDTMVTNGDLSSIMRHEGLTLLVSKLIETAAKLGIKALICHSIDAGTISRAKLLGFKETNQTVISLLL